MYKSAVRAEVSTTCDQAPSSAHEKSTKQNGAAQCGERANSFFWHNPVLQDSALIAFSILFCALPFIRDLGFYSDDWQFLGIFTNLKDQSFGAGFQAMTGIGQLMRPVQAVCLSALYWLFGTNPLGYHVVIVGMLILNSILLYLVVRHFTEKRLVALSCSLVFSLLPNYSTDRLWLAACQVNVSSILYLAGLLFSFKALVARGRRLWLLSGVAFIFVLSSLLAYELTLPLVLSSPLLLWCKQRMKKTGPRPWLSLNLILISSLTLAAGCLSGLYVFLTTTRYQPNQDHLRWLFYAAKEIVKVHFIEYGALLPNIDWSIFETFHNPVVYSLGLSMGILVFWYMLRVAKSSPEALPTLEDSSKIVGSGVLIVALGYSIFLFAPHQVGFETTGIANRTAEVASIGIAMVFVGGASLLSIMGILRKIRPHVFCLVLSFLVVTGFLINNYIASFWVEASQGQEKVLRDIRQRFPVLPAKDTLLVDGECPYDGPGIVFETYWDMSGALRTVYHDPKIDADVVTRKVRLSRVGLSTSIYDVPRLYPYGSDLIIFNIRRRIVDRLSNFGVARSYFRHFNPDYGNGCVSGLADHGTPLWHFRFLGKDIITLPQKPNT